MIEYDDDESVRVVLEVRYAVDDPSRDCLAVIGSAKSLGCWESNSAAVANYIGLSTWQCAVRLPKYQTTYWKWILMNTKSKQVWRWEEICHNRSLDINNNDLIVSSDWNGKETVKIVDPSIREILQEQALMAHVKTKEEEKTNRRKSCVCRTRSDADANSNCAVSDNNMNHVTSDVTITRVSKPEAFTNGAGLKEAGAVHVDCGNAKQIDETTGITDNTSFPLTKVICILKSGLQSFLYFSSLFVLDFIGLE